MAAPLDWFRCFPGQSAILCAIRGFAGAERATRKYTRRDYTKVLYRTYYSFARGENQNQGGHLTFFAGRYSRGSIRWWWHAGLRGHALCLTARGRSTRNDDGKHGERRRRVSPSGGKRRERHDKKTERSQENRAPLCDIRLDGRFCPGIFLEVFPRGSAAARVGRDCRPRASSADYCGISSMMNAS